MLSLNRAVLPLIMPYCNTSPQPRQPKAGAAQTVKKTCPAKSFGGKDSVKGNRQGVLSRSITRRSGRIAK